MDNNEIIRRLWEKDTTDPKVVDMLYSMSVNTEDRKMSNTKVLVLQGLFVFLWR